jgi:hypothetical protein
MYRIDNADATSTLPTPLAPGPVPRGFFQSGNPSIGQKATTVDRDWANTQQEEIANVVEAAGITLSKTNNAQLLAALRTMFITRTAVTGNMTIYVNPTSGNDAFNGLTPATAFRTIQAAINSVYYWYDWAGHTATIQLADGTYGFATANGFAALFTGMPFGMRPGSLFLMGNTAFPGNVIINATNANCLGLFQTWLVVRGITFTATGSLLTPSQQQGVGVNLNISAYLDMQSCQLGSCGFAQVACSNASQVAITGAGMTFTGSTPYPLWASEGGTIWCPAPGISVVGLTITGGASAFAASDSSASINAIGATFAGSATGVRYIATNNGTIVTGGGGANFFPGSIAGSPVPGVAGPSGGQYN